jgi:MoxR-like ATPase
MARYHDQTAIYEVARTFAEECLFKDGSYFWPGEQVWTEANLDTIWREFAEKPDEGRDSFVVKWAKQLAGQSVEIFRLAYEVTAIYCLFPSSAQFGPEAKQNLLQDVRGMGPDLGTNSSERNSVFQDAILGVGIGMPGTGYLTNRPFHIGMYLAFASVVKRSGERSLERLNPKATVHEALAMVGSTMHHQPYASLNILLHIFWPDQFEGTSSADYKRRMARNLSTKFGLNELDDVDATILQARKYIEEGEHFPKDFNMYSDAVRPLWDEASAPSASKKFELAAQFRERVLENNRSFLWPNVENVWTPENALAALELTKHLAGQTQAEAHAEMLQILREAERPIFHILCDVRAAYVLRSVGKEWIAENLLQSYITMQGPFDGDQQTRQALVNSASEKYPGMVKGSGGVPTINQMLIILAGLQAILADPKSIGDRDAMVARLFNHSVKIENDGLMYFPFWILLYLMYPEQVPPTPAWSLRERLRRKYRYMTEGIEYPNYMAELADVRARLDPDFDPYTFDFFAEPWVSLGSNQSLAGGGEVEVEGPEVEADDRVDPTIADLAAATHLDESFLREIKNLLDSKPQLIFEGPPGSGKTFVAEKFARYITGQPLDGDRNDQIELIQFHQSYSYEDFVEGIRPDTNDDGQLVYEVVPGIFLELVSRAIQRPLEKFVLIIDEINRGNVSRILGELMLLLEYREQTATLPYSKQQLRIPDNLYIIGTMNSADRSLSQIDYALRRRFYFVPFMSVEHGKATVLERWLQLHAPQSMAAVPLFVALNNRLRQHMGTDDLQVGHSYFMRADIHTDTMQQQVWKYAVMPLLREYLYHHRDRDTLLQQYTLSVLNPPKEPVGQDEAVNETQSEDV